MESKTKSSGKNLAFSMATSLERIFFVHVSDSPPYGPNSRTIRPLTAVTSYMRMGEQGEVKAMTEATI